MIKSCARCGAQNPPEFTACGTCGMALAQAPSEFGKHTMLGFAAPPGAMPQSPPIPAAATSPGQSLRGTMLGFPAMAPPQAQPPTAAQPAPAAGPASLHGTMLGIAPPEVRAALAAAPTAAAPEAPSPASTAVMAPMSAPAPSQFASDQRTMLGVARPGIAPMNPGQAKPAPLPAPQFAGAYPAEPLPAPEPLDAPAPPRKAGISALAAIVIVASGTLLSAAAVAFFFYKGHGPIEAKPRLDAAGKEELELRCADCSDGTVVRHGTNSATFKAHQAVLPLGAPLRIGDNELSLGLERPGKPSDHVNLKVPVEFRVRGETKGLEETPPRLGVLVSAVADSRVIVDNKPLALSGTEGRFDVDVSAELTGAEAQIQRLERRIPYAVTAPNGVAQSGSVTLQLGIAPLVVDAPGESVVIEKPSFVLAGHTAKGGTVTVAGSPITVDASGRFAQVMNVSAPGQTTILVRAMLPDHAPRLFPLRVRRVESLAKEAERVRTGATSNYAALLTSAPGASLALDGSVVEARVEGYVTRMLLDVKGGCAAPPCLAKVSYGAATELSANGHVSVFGKLRGMVEGPRTGKMIPDVSAEIVLRGKR